MDAIQPALGSLMHKQSETEQLFAELRSPLALLSPKWLYDDTGSGLFETITQLPEYYPTRVELSLLDSHASKFASLIGPANLTELGSGSSPKTQSLIRGFLAAGTLETYAAFDVNANAAQRSVQELTRMFPTGNFTAQHGDFNRGIPQPEGEDIHVIAFLGSTIGNFTPAQRHDFLCTIHASMRPGDWFLLGVDLVKEPSRLIAAYDDESGVTEAFIMNVLSNINNVCGTDFAQNNFIYAPSWNPQEQRIEMRLVSIHDHTVSSANDALFLGSGVEILVEISTKFHLPDIKAELAALGLHPAHQVVASESGHNESDFALILAQRE